MRDPERIERMLRALGQLWMTQPDTRLCQLILNVAYPLCKSNDPFFVEDDAFEKALVSDLAREYK